MSGVRVAGRGDARGCRMASVGDLDDQHFDVHPHFFFPLSFPGPLHTRSSKGTYLCRHNMRPQGSHSSSAAVGTTVISGQAFSAIPSTYALGSTTADVSNLFSLTQTSLYHGNSGANNTSVVSGSNLPQLMRPLSPFERAGIVNVMARSSIGPSSPGPSRSSSSLGGSVAPLPILSPAEDEKFDPSLAWYESHYFYTNGKKSAAPTGSKGKRGSLSASVNEDSPAPPATAEDGSSPTSITSPGSTSFFQRVLSAGWRARNRNMTYVGEYGSATQEIRQMVISNSAPPALRAFCSNLIFKVDEEGYVTFGDFVQFITDLVPPPLCEAYSDICLSFLNEAGGTAVIQSDTAVSSDILAPAQRGSRAQAPSSPGLGSPSKSFHTSSQQGNGPASPLAAGPPQWMQWRLPFVRVYDTVQSMFLGRSDGIIRKCFDLCDVSRCGYILKDHFRRFRDEDALLHLASASTNVGSPGLSGSVTGTSFTASPLSMTAMCVGGVYVPPPQLTYLVAKGVWRIFERVALAEEENVRNAGGKGKKGKKSKKNQTGPVQVPGKRQFHINFKEFCSAVQEDAHVLLAFLPYAMEVSVQERMLAS